MFDKEGWALHNVGRLLQPAVEAAGHSMLLVGAEEYYRAPVECDVLYLSFSFLFRNGFPYREWARELICTIHDPFEVSNFTNRLDWPRLPLRPVSPQVFDRVSAISAEMYEVLRRFPCRALYRTPTFPHDAGEIAAARRPYRPGAPVRFFSATNVDPQYTMKEIVGRLRYIDVFLRDERRRLSLRQLSSIAIRTHRKNLPWLRRMEADLRERPGAVTDFRYGKRTPKPRDAYLASLTEADVYVCTSFMEGGPLPVMEAVTAGLAVLSTPVGQVEEWVRDGENGFICRSVSEFRERALEYVGNPALLQRHRRRSVEIAEEKAFDPRPWLDFVTGRAAPNP